MYLEVWNLLVNNLVPSSSRTWLALHHRLLLPAMNKWYMTSHYNPREAKHLLYWWHSAEWFSQEDLFCLPLITFKINMGKHPFSREEETNLTYVFLKAFQVLLLQMHKDSGATDESVFLLNFFCNLKESKRIIGW